TNVGPGRACTEAGAGEVHSRRTVGALEGTGGDCESATVLEEGGASWGFASRGVPWTSAGGDLHPGGVEAVLPATADERGSIGIDVTPLVAAWMSGSVPNRGLVLDVGVADRGQSFASREHADRDRRPALVIDLAADVPGGSPPTDLLLSTARLPEKAGADRAVGLLAAVDPDVGDTHGVSLVAGFGDNGLFRVDGSVLRATRSFDFETRSSYSVRVRVADRQGATFEKTFTITVTDVTTAPVVTEVRVPTAGGYRAGQPLVWQIVCSQDVVVTGRPVVPVRVGGRAVAATYVGGSGTSRLTFASAISAADHAAVVQTGGAIVYPGGATIMGEARLVGALPRGGGIVPGVSIDTVAPRTVGTVRTPPARTYSVGEFLDFTVRFSERVRVVGVPQLAVQLAPGAAGSRTADYVGGSGGTDLRFRYVVRAGDPASATRGIVVAGLLRGGQIGDVVGNPADRRLTMPDTTRIIVDGRGRAVARSDGPGEATERVRQNGRSRAFSLLAASRGATTP
ncbi:MAG: cadherin domain-containing protein, partial [Planctomycetia bacterium]